MTAELVDVTELAALSGASLGDDRRIRLLILVDSLDDRDVIAAVTEALGRAQRSGGAVGAAGWSEALDLLRVWRDALAHDVKLRDLADRTSLDPDVLLEVLLAEVVRGPRTGLTGASLSVGEQELLADAGVDLSAPPADAPDPSAATAARFARLLADALSVDEAAARLRVTPGRIRQRLAERTLYGIQARTRGSWRLPAWQFEADATVPGIEAVLPHLPPHAHPLAVSNFFTQPDPDLVVGEVPLSPLDWLRSGGAPGAVAALAGELSAAF